MWFKASAPGSLMLFGEYAVLHGKHAIVSAIDKRITVTLTPRQDKKIIIRSALGMISTHLSELNKVAPFQFVLATLQYFQKKMHSGCEIDILAEFSENIGFASSAAVTVATLAVISKWLALPFSKLTWVRQARSIVRNVQGIGSGADVAASIFGGMIFYRATSLLVLPLAHDYPLTVVYSGSKTPTKEAVQRVKHNFQRQLPLFNSICQAIDCCVLEVKLAMEKKDWQQVGNLMNIHQGLLDALGVNTLTLQNLIDKLRVNETILGAKISGSGFGDCVIGLGNFPHIALQQEKGEQYIPVAIATQGVRYEKN